MAEASFRPRYVPARPLPPYAYVPGAGLPHPVNDPRGHLHRAEGDVAVDSGTTAWEYALDLFNHGFAWEAHEAWEGFWNAWGRTTHDAALVQGLIHLAAACVKIREGKPNGVARHARRARELLADACAGADDDGVLGIDPRSIEAVLDELDAYQAVDQRPGGSQGCDPESAAPMKTEGFRSWNNVRTTCSTASDVPACSHTASAPVVSVLDAVLVRAAHRA